MHNRLKAIRKELELSQRDFGSRLGVHNTAISKIESGNNNLTEQMIKSVCREFGVDYIWLTTGDGNMFINTDN